MTIQHRGRRSISDFLGGMFVTLLDGAPFSSRAPVGHEMTRSVTTTVPEERFPPRFLLGLRVNWLEARLADVLKIGTAAQLQCCYRPGGTFRRVRPLDPADKRA